MRNGLFRTIMAACALLLFCTNVGAAERYHTSTLKYVYPLGNGDFVIVFHTDGTLCPAAGPDKYYYVMVGQNGMTSEGSKKIYAAALSAVVAGMTADIAFDDATTNCYVNRLVLKST